MATADSNPNLNLLLRWIQIHEQLSPTVVLHYDHPSRDLRTWFWCVLSSSPFACTLIIDFLRPVTEKGSRVPPSDLLDHRVHYNFCAPCCLCIPNADGCGFTETAIYVALSGPYAGEYVAGCASDTCGYLSKLLYVPATVICLRSLEQSSWNAYTP